jgi:hypothetical protein
MGGFIDHQLYVAGGMVNYTVLEGGIFDEDSTPSMLLNAYDPIEDTWERFLPPMVDGARAGGMSITTETDLWVMGGSTAGDQGGAVTASVAS